MVSTSLISLGLGLLSALSVAAPVDIIKRDSPLKVTLSATQENGVVEAAVTNDGAIDLSILKLGSIFADEPIQKVIVTSGEEALEFKGIRLRYKTNDLGADAFTTIAAGETVKTTIELTGLYELPSSIKVTASGIFKYTEGTSDTISAATVQDTGSVEYESNVLELSIDTEAAAQAGTLGQALEKRVVRSGCSGSRATALNTALSLTASRASAAASAASAGGSTFSEYFHTTSSSTRSTVAARLRAVSSAASSTSGSVTYYCTDVYGYCSSNVLAWTLPSSNVIANCDIYYTYLPSSTSTCHDQDQWTTSLHELTHAPGVYSPGTDDIAYGYADSTSLSTSQAVLNADTYALYAQAVYLNC